MDLHARRHDKALVLQAAGRIDHLAAAAFEAALAPHLAGCSADGHSLILDLSALDYISSAGLRILMLAAKQAKTVGGRILLAAPQPVVREILEISRFDRVFELRDSLAEALATVAKE